MRELFILAQGKVKPEDIGLKNPITDPNAALGNILNAVYFWAGVIAIIVIIIAGILYSSSTANPSQTKRAREAVIYSVVGLVVILMAFVVTQYILGRF